MRRILLIGKAGAGKSTRIFRLLPELAQGRPDNAVRFASFSRATSQRLHQLKLELHEGGPTPLIRTIQSFGTGHMYHKSDFYPHRDARKAYRLMPMREHDYHSIFNDIGVEPGRIRMELDDESIEVASSRNTLMNGYHLMFSLLPAIMQVNPLAPDMHERLRVHDDAGWQRVAEKFITDHAVHYFTADTGRHLTVLERYLSSFMTESVKYMQEHMTFDYAFSLYLAALCPDYDISYHGQYPVVIDEAQDLNLLQIASLARSIHNAEKLVIAGDPDQSIYSFMGITHPYLFHEDLQEQLRFTERIVLDTTHRCGEAIVRAADHIIAPNYAANPDAHVPTVSLKREGQIHLDAPLLDTVVQLQNEDTLILCRTNYHCHEIETVLLRNMIPFTRLKGKKTERGALNMRSLVLLSHLHQIANDQDQEAMVQPAYISTLKAILEKKDAENAPWIEGIGAPVPFSELEINANDLADYLEQARSALWAATGKDIADYDAFREAWQNESLWVEPKIRIGTVYRAKGAEARNVIIDPRITGTIQQHLEGGEFRFIDEAERRVWYTAITRTKGDIWILAPRSINGRLRNTSYLPLYVAIPMPL